MSQITGIAPEVVETIVFSATNPPVVRRTFRGSTVARDEAGKFTITLPVRAQIDPGDRSVITGQEVVAPNAPGISFEIEGGDDGTVVVGVTDVDGNFGDSTNNITVEISRIRNR